MFALRQTWNIAPSSQCEMKFARVRAANISRELSHFTRRRRISLAHKGKFHWKRHLQLIAVPNKATISFSEIARLARGEIIYFVNCEIWCCASSEIKFVPSYAAGISHICEANISHRRYFTRSVGTNFTEKWRVKSEEVISKIGKLLLKLADLGGRGWIRTTEAETTDLQSAPFDRSGTLPYSVFVEVGKKLELVDGFEPPTCWLQISCSTSWATPASQRSNNISQIERWVKP